MEQREIEHPNLELLSYTSSLRKHQFLSKTQHTTNLLSLSIDPTTVHLSQTKPSPSHCMYKQLLLAPLGVEHFGFLRCLGTAKGLWTFFVEINIKVFIGLILFTLSRLHHSRVNEYSIGHLLD
mmetsp:Transcript_12425/g.27005  ORF Transcript_12425/g.27005 Transcript_12425/m.27005 type:complete len:123 (-) Transcript_12425:1477-1845(-)